MDPKLKEVLEAVLKHGFEVCDQLEAFKNEEKRELAEVQLLYALERLEKLVKES